MKKYFTLLLILIANRVVSQVPQIAWTKCLGGSGNDKAYSIIPASDGYFLCGLTGSTDGDVTFNYGHTDGWVVKTDLDGVIQWQKSYGGSNSDLFRAILPISNNRYMLCGETSSSDGDVTFNHGESDFWVVQIDASGTLLWQNTYGGSNVDAAMDIIPSDSGYFVVGQTFSPDGDVHNYKDSGDAWLIVIDTLGNLTDSKTKGGSQEDIFNEIRPTTLGGYIICGSSASTDGSVNGLNHGGSDAWLTKLSKNGSAQWTQCYGDTGNDAGFKVIQNGDGSYAISGQYGAGTNEESWLFEVDSNGVLTSNFNYGGDDIEDAGPLLKDPVGSFVISASSASPVSGDVECHLGANDIWMYSSSFSTTLNWQKCLGGTGDEWSSAILLNADSSMIVCGYTNSTDGDVVGNHGDFDFWIVKLATGCSSLANFTNTVDGMTVTFSNESQNSISWFWDFGDGTTSTDENPIHVYSGVGAYNVCLTASNTTCTPFTYCADVYICGDPVISLFAFSVSGSTATFHDLSTNENMWYWTFGDGQTSTAENPIHVYGQNGEYEACLISTQEGCSVDTSCKLVTVCAYETVADFEYTLTSLTLSFIDISESATSWSWTFGDGSTSTDQNPVHTYAADGTYEVCLIASDLCDADTICETITICSAPEAGFSYFATSDLTINFVDESDNALGWFWDFGDGQTSTSPNPVHEYGGPGTYEVCLIVTNDCSEDTLCEEITIECPPFDGAFTFTQDANSVSFTDQSSASATNWLWDFGDGTTSTQENPTHIFGVDGTYIVCLMVTDGCSTDTICEEIQVTGTFSGEPGNGTSFHVYPNPFDKFTTITFDLTSNSRITITLNDVSGRILKSLGEENYPAGEHQVVIRTEDLFEGIYFVRLLSEKGATVQKVIVAKN